MPIRSDAKAGRHPESLHKPTLVRHLLAWYDAHRRDLPWRHSRDPYRIWISEVMLQQTTVAAVVPYFHRFLDAFPTIRQLAEADEQQVLKLWEGLGYYRRARHLHAAAKLIVTEHAGLFPNDPNIVAELPGVGRYILGAVMSQAFEQRLPIVEANSLRVLSRLFGYRGDPREGEGKAWVWEAAEAVLPKNRIGDFNQAMMELGATVCTPVQPRCGSCPLAKQCVAKRDGTIASIPPPKVQKPPTEVRDVALAIRKGSRLLVCRRPSDAKRGSNLWEFPHAELLPGEPLDVAIDRVAEELTGMQVQDAKELMAISHRVTRFAIAMTAMEVNHHRGRFRSNFYTEGHWVEPAELSDYPTSTPQRKLFDRVKMIKPSVSR